MDKEFFFVQYQSEGKLGRRPKKSMSCSLDPVLFVGNKKKVQKGGEVGKKKKKKKEIQEMFPHRYSDPVLWRG